jgi:hypothetical protein
VLPQLDTVIGGEKGDTRPTKELVMGGVTAMNGTLVEKGGKILGEKGIGGGSGGLLEDVNAVGTPGGTANFGGEDALPAGEVGLGGGKLEGGGPTDLFNQLVPVAGPGQAGSRLCEESKEAATEGVLMGVSSSGAVAGRT